MDSPCHASNTLTNRTLGFMYPVLLLIVIFSSVNSQIETFPEDVGGQVGENINITCRVVSENALAFVWREFVTTTDPGGKSIYTDPPGTVTDPTKYAVHGKYELEVKNGQLTDAGRYTCNLLGGTLYASNIIIFESVTLSADVMTENQMSNLECNVTFNASDPNPHGLSMTFEVNGRVVSPDDVTLGKNILSGYSSYNASRDDDNTTFVCVISLTSPAGYSIQNSTILDITYNISQPTFRTEKENYEVGESITCEAPGNPPSTIIWESVQSPAGDITINDPVLEITQNMTNHDKTNENVWRCTANQTGVYGTISEASEIQFSVGGNRSENETENGGLSKGEIIGIVCGVLAAVVVAIAIGLGVHFHKKKKKGKDDVSTDGVTNEAPKTVHSEEIHLNTAGGSPVEDIDRYSVGKGNTKEADAYRPKPGHYAVTGAKKPQQKEQRSPASQSEYALAGHNKDEKPGVVYSEVRKPGRDVYSEVKKPGRDVYSEVKKPGKDVYSDVKKPEGDVYATTMFDNAQYAPFVAPTPKKSKPLGKLPPIAATTKDDKK